MAWDGTRFYALDGNTRILIYDELPTSAAAVPTGVIGQTNFTNITTGVSQSKVNFPFDIAAAPNAVVVADSANHRVLIFSPPPAANAIGPDATYVLGQPDFSTNTANYGGSVSRQTLNSPRTVAFDGTHLIVGDYGNNRVLIWNSLPTQNQQPADVVLGQTDFSSNSSSTGSLAISPYGIWTDGTRLLISSLNNRVLFWRKIPTENGTQADAVIGQPDFSTFLSSIVSGVSMNTLYGPRHAIIYGSWIYIADTGNSRILALPGPK